MSYILDNEPVPDLVRAQALIQRQPDVVQADVWQGKGGRLMSRVVVCDDSRLDGIDVQNLCLKELGAQSTPCMVVIEHARRRVA